MNFKEIVENMRNWAEPKGLLDSNIIGNQKMEVLKELGELSGSILKKNQAGIIDGLGDSFCTLIVLGLQMGIEYEGIEFKTDPDENWRQNTLELPIWYLLMGIPQMVSGLESDSQEEVFTLFASFTSLLAIAIKLELDLMECVETSWNEFKDRTAGE